MKKRLMATMLIVVLFVGMLGTGFAAANTPEPFPFGADVVPLTQAEMKEVEGAIGTHIAVFVVAGAFGGAAYLANTAPADRTWLGGLAACATTGLGALMGRFY